jgi:hypothetical protein
MRMGREETIPAFVHAFMNVLASVPLNVRIAGELLLGVAKLADFQGLYLS